MRTAIYNVILVNEGKQFPGTLILKDEEIADILPEGETRPQDVDKMIDGEGAFLLPGIIDEHVHFRDPGMTQKGSIETESRAALAGGVTSIFDMPNTMPLTTTLEAWEQKMEIADRDCRVNYAFFFGATNNNTDLFQHLDSRHMCGIKLFMGSSTGNMLVDRQKVIEKIFRTSPYPVMTHCEDNELIKYNTTEFCAKYGPDPDVKYHPLIRSREACYRSTALAVELAKQCGTHLHVAHISTQEELNLFTSETPNITAEACIQHLFFCDKDYARLGTRIKCNPAIKGESDREALRHALTDGRISTIGTDHAPHLLQDKKGGAIKASSGMPMVQFSLICMLELVDQHVLPITRVADLMCHNPAKLFHVDHRGFLRKGYKADLVLVRKHDPWVLTKDMILSRCGWSPLEGTTFHWKVEKTFCNGHLAYTPNNVNDAYRGQAIVFNHD